MKELIPNRRNRILIQAAFLGTSAITAVEIIRTTPLLIIAGIVLTLAIAAIFARTTMRRFIVANLPATSAPTRPYWPGVFIALAVLATVIYMMLGLSGVVPLGEQGIGAIFIAGGLLYARLSRFFTQAEMMGQEMFHRKPSLFGLRERPMIHVAIGLVMAGYGLLMILGIWR